KLYFCCFCLLCSFVSLFIFHEPDFQIEPKFPGLTAEIFFKKNFSANSSFSIACRLSDKTRLFSCPPVGFGHRSAEWLVVPCASDDTIVNHFANSVCYLSRQQKVTVRKS
ncbi:hypothetical protein, partial [uncultured Duncaniella sp.]|uniref:hypothetical protein n=1 Tax=uncultured Duncaniella sp. TaxID=2768039 RepID=UPI00260337D1